MSMFTFDHYALIQSGYAIYGVGTTEQEARDDASEWLQGDERITDNGEIVAITPQQIAEAAAYEAELSGAYRVDGALCVVRCTKALYDAVKTDGTEDWAEDPGSQGICLPHELEGC